ncbi:TPA: hypothetical protein NJ332_004664 [Vibrio parahaemolyticus]|nr:hypothetical protein [Vibrio parahaemolyticus]
MKYIAICENQLRNLKQNLVDNDIRPRDVELIEHLLSRTEELRVFYKELLEQLDERQVFFVLEAVIDVAVNWNPDEMKQARRDKKELETINEQIVSLAEQLATLLDKRYELKNSSDFTCDSVVRVTDLIQLAANGNYLFSNYLKDDITLLGNQYEYNRYWPSISNIVRAIGDDASDLEVYSGFKLTEVATESKRSSNRDFLRALFVALEEDKKDPVKRIPSSFRLTDVAMASIATCALYLDGGAVTEDNVKTMRHSRVKNA